MVFIHDYFPSIMHRYAMKYVDILKVNNIKYEIVNCHQPDFWDKLKTAELLIFYVGTDDIHLQQIKSILNVINQQTSLKCFPNYESSWHLDDKVSQYYLLKSHNLPVVDCRIYWDKDLALDFVNKTPYPVIFKLKRGAGSLNVVKVDNHILGLKLVNAMFGKGITAGTVPGIKKSVIYNSDIKRVVSNTMGRVLAELGLRNKPYHSLMKERGYVLFQEFLPDNAHDTRVTIIGNRAFAFRRFNRPNDFRSSGSGLIDYDSTKIDLSIVQTAFQISQELGFQTMSYDFLLDKNGKHKIIEMCHLFADWAVYKCPGYWDEELIWHEGHFWPQYCELINLLGRDDLQQPEFEVYMGRENSVSLK